MRIEHKAMAGTLESSDVMVTVEPAEQGIQLSITSPVIRQFGRAIKQTALETMERLGVIDAKVTIVDQGALDCTLKARLESAVYRSVGITENIPWGRDNV
ncbi:MAG: citrate lyase acyl carrier protein [Christensenellaceae bacterium]|nr:citrate lyase acyl carrier protein [Christensenellaceae bacterium]